MAFSDLRRSPLINRINRFLESPAYILAAALLSLLSSMFSLELPVYTLYIMVVVYVCLFGDDLLPVMPLVVLCYIAPSASNNPGRNGDSIFDARHGGWYLLTLVGFMAAGLVYFLLRDGRKYLKLLFTNRRKLIWGMLLLWAAYMLSGIGSPAYPAFIKKNVFFGFLQGVSVTVPYFLFTGLVDWKKARKDYFGWVGVGAGLVLLGQFLWIYITKPVIQNGVIDRNLIYTGWGMYNNMGGLLAMMIPFPFYLGMTHKKGWFGAVAGTLFLGGVFLSNSRTSMLAGAAVYGICVLILFFTTTNKKRTLVAAAVVAVVGIAGVVVLHEKIFQLFEDILSRGFSLNHRDEFYIAGVNQFVKYPVFGGSFYPIDYVPWDWSEVASFSKFFPPRWHNTLIQLLACTGTVGLVAYLIHRLQTVRLMIQERSAESRYITLSILVLIFCSLFDCHFFNIGPVLFYSMALAFAEKKQQ